jgi:DNA-binding transcriptional ArsR family regulator
MPLADRQIEEVARSFALLSDPTRLRILSYLLEAGEASPTDIAVAIGVGRTTVSQHLSRLLAAGMIGRRRDGHAAQYRVVDDHLRPLCELICSSVRSRGEARLTAVGR